MDIPIAYQALEVDHGSLVLVEDALTGLQQALWGQFVLDEDLDEALGQSPRGVPARPKSE
jgi:hypothetical protein